MKSDSLAGLYSTLAGDELDEVSRARLRCRVLEALHSAPAAGRNRAPWLAFGAAAAAIALALGAVLILQFQRREREEPTLTIQANGGVHLEWTDVGKERYRVLRSTSPADFSKAAARTVQGTTYLDREPGEGPVVYYRVE